MTKLIFIIKTVIMFFITSNSLHDGDSKRPHLPLLRSRRIKFP